jgi:hypothetical protein
MKRLVLALSLLLSAACVTGQPSIDYDNEPTRIDLPLVQVSNRNFEDAIVYMNGRKLTEVLGVIGDKLIILHTYDVPASGVMQFSFLLIAPGIRMDLPDVRYQPGRKMYVQINASGPGRVPTTSTAW